MKNFLIKSADIQRDSYVWNMAGSLIVAFQSVIILFFMTRTVGLEQAGIFTIAYANANLFMNIGKFGMRYFQVSDTKKEFSFGEYRRSRKYTYVIGMGVSLAYVLIVGKAFNYSAEKVVIILLMCLYKMADAIEDVYIAFYQSVGRLDVGAKIMTLRVALSILLYVTLIWCCHNQVVAILVTTLFTYLLMMIFLIMTKKVLVPVSSYNVRKGKIIMLIQKCLPLFIGTFLAFYIGNAPKYAIDAQLSDEAQACYGFVAMPVFVIGLLNNFIFNPIIHSLAMAWEEGRYKEFSSRIRKQLYIILGLTIVCVIGAYYLGIPVLSFLYATNLSSYKLELIILLIGGGFFALTGFLNTLITIIRAQKQIATAYILVALCAIILSNPIVQRYGVMGASFLYLGLMILLSICFTFILIVGMSKRKGKSEEA